MQELQPIPGLAGWLFDGGGAAANALLRRHGGSPAAAQRQEAAVAAAEVRCPRCGSANTKFCYYNNYNLAQPRHLCRTCRRYWTKGGHLRNVPVGGGCRKTKPSKRPTAGASAAADGSNKNGVHGAHRDGKASRSGCAGASASSAADGDADAPASSVFCVVTEPSGPSSVVETGTAGDTRTLTLAPPPAPMFADQAVVFASLFAPPRPLPAFSSSAQPKQAEEHVAGLLAAERQPPASAAAGEGTALPFAARSDGALAAGASDWPTAACDAGLFELAGGIAGDASLPAYWNAGSWADTDTDTTVYLP